MAGRAGGLLLRAMVPFEPATPPVPRDGVRPRVVIADGRADPIVPAGQPLEARFAAGLRQQLREPLGLLGGHQLVQRDLELGQALLDELRQTARRG